MWIFALALGCAAWLIILAGAAALVATALR